MAMRETHAELLELLVTDSLDHVVSFEMWLYCSTDTLGPVSQNRLSCPFIPSVAYLSASGTAQNIEDYLCLYSCMIALAMLFPQLMHGRLHGRAIPIQHCFLLQAAAQVFEPFLGLSPFHISDYANPAWMVAKAAFEARMVPIEKRISQQLQEVLNTNVLPALTAAVAQHADRASAAAVQPGQVSDTTLLFQGALGQAYPAV